MKYLFVIDTDEYAGNFEREMCAYITGQTGDCEVGEDMANIYRREEKDEEGELFENILSDCEDDDHGCNRPVNIYPTVGWENDGRGNHSRLKKGKEPKCPCYNSVAIKFSSKPTKGQIELMKRRANNFAKAKKSSGNSWEKNFKLNIEGFRLIKIQKTETEESI